MEDKEDTNGLKSALVIGAALLGGGVALVAGAVAYQRLFGDYSATEAVENGEKEASMHSVENGTRTEPNMASRASSKVEFSKSLPTALTSSPGIVDDLELELAEALEEKSDSFDSDSDFDFEETVEPETRLNSSIPNSSADFSNSSKSVSSTPESHHGGHTRLDSITDPVKYFFPHSDFSTPPVEEVTVKDKRPKRSARDRILDLHQPGSRASAFLPFGDEPLDLYEEEPLDLSDLPFPASPDFHDDSDITANNNSETSTHALEEDQETLEEVRKSEKEPTREDKCDNKDQESPKEEERDKDEAEEKKSGDDDNDSTEKIEAEGDEDETGDEENDENRSDERESMEEKGEGKEAEEERKGEEKPGKMKKAKKLLSRFKQKHKAFYSMQEFDPKLLAEEREKALAEQEKLQGAS